MKANEVLLEAYSRITQNVENTLKDLTTEDLTYRIDPGANTVAWLVWHLARVEDSQISSAAGLAQVWDQGWYEKFNFAPVIGPHDTGYGHSNEQVTAIVANTKLLTEYYEDVCHQTKKYLESINEDDLDIIIDKNWNPPVTLGVRLASILVDISQHVGQANYVRGVILRQKSDK